MLPRKNKNKQNKIAKVLIGFIVLMLVLVISVKSYELRKVQQEYAFREAQLTEQIEKEQERAQEIAEYETYTHTKAYFEDIARDKLGLVYEGEIIFKDEN